LFYVSTGIVHTAIPEPHSISTIVE